MIQRLRQTFKATVVHVGIRKFDVAQAGDFKFQGVLRTLRDVHSSPIHQCGIHRQAIVFKFPVGKKRFGVAACAVAFKKAVARLFLLRKFGFPTLHPIVFRIGAYERQHKLRNDFERMFSGDAAIVKGGVK